MKTKFGWGFKSRHGMSFVSNKTPDLAVAGASFSHMGKHAPVIFLEEGKASQPVYDDLLLFNRSLKMTQHLDRIITASY